MIPDQGLQIIPKNQYHKLMHLFDNIYESWIIDQDKTRRKYFVWAFNMIKNEVMDLFRDNNFWIIYSMHGEYCTYRYKKGPMSGMICGSKIHIICEKDNGKWRCYDHISKTLYSSKKRENIDPIKLCLGKTKYNKHLLPCKNLKWNNSDFCKVHYKLPKKATLNNAFYSYYLNKKKEKDILEEKIKKIDINYHFNQKDKIVYNYGNRYVIPYIIKSTNLFYDSNI